MVKVSIITYVFCSKENKRIPLLKECLQSIKKQKFDYEHIIIDDGSTVDIKGIVESYPNTRYFKMKRYGIIGSTVIYNKGFQEMRGIYGMICSSDDIQLPNAMKVLSTWLDKHPKDVAIVGGALHQFIRNGKMTKQQKKTFDTVLNNNSLLKRNFVNGCAIMFRKTALDKIELPKDKAGMCADWDMWLKISEVGRIRMIPTMVIKYRDFGNATRHKTRNTRKKRNSKEFVRRSAIKRRRGY